MRELLLNDSTMLLIKCGCDYYHFIVIVARLTAGAVSSAVIFKVVKERECYSAYISTAL